ncbi:MAG: RluA family pseudouridine synthase [Clostridia bacterium]|nr:RluA family pseudouridine synthase [Clostridia bacterium]
MNIIYKDNYLIVCQKDCGELSEGDSQDSVTVKLSEALCSQGEKNTQVFSVHRLDRETVGVMVFARDSKSAAALSESIRTDSFTKEYLAIIHGVPEKEHDTLSDLLFYDRSHSKSFVVHKKRAGVKQASLEYSVLETASLSDLPISLLRIKLHTGRTHQIRVQLASRRHPLLGDRRYGAPKDGVSSVALLSHTLSFPHPQSHQTLTFSVTPPDVFPWNIFKFLNN